MKIIIDQFQPITKDFGTKYFGDSFIVQNDNAISYTISNFPPFLYKKDDGFSF